MRRSVRMLVLGLLAVAVAIPAWPAGARDGTAGIAVHRVRIAEFRFRPRTLTIERGDVVRWRNRGDVSHTTTSDDGVWDSGTLSPGETFRKRFRRRGTFDYHCEIHTNMTATIVVT